MGGIQDAIIKASRRIVDTTPYVSVAVITLKVSGSGTAEATSSEFNFGGLFITEPAGGILQENATDASGNSIILQTTVKYSKNANGLYKSAHINVLSLQDVGSYTVTIHAAFMGRGYAEQT